MRHQVVPPRKAQLFARVLEHEQKLQARVAETEAIADRQAMCAFEERITSYYYVSTTV